VEFSVSGSAFGSQSRASASGARKNTKLIKCAGLGGNPSSISGKKVPPKAKKPTTDIFASKSYVKPTVFKLFYERNDLPIVVDFDGATRKIQWKV